MEKIKIAIVGFGNVGKKVYEAVEESPDMETAGIVELAHLIEKLKVNIPNVPVVDNIEKLGKVDVAILAIDSRHVPSTAPIYLNMGINTVDAYDIHGDSMIELKESLDKISKEKNTVSIMASGWDPGTDSIIRAVLEMIAPKGLTTVNFGPGMSMGHTVAVKATPGVKDAISITVPKGMGLHKRLVYIELEDGYDFNEVSKEIKDDSYFNQDETYVFCVDNVKNLIDMGHGVHIERKGVSGNTHNQKMDFTMSLTNPAATAQVMVSAARASLKQNPGCYTLIEIPPIDCIYGERISLIKRFV
ncbi:meso-diaminopimelate D-dehydrogenase [Tepidanaerobacter syntrophicus]|uniref:Meso-diaminopimelate D-dehydrogenase n=1 Tax=Tepidanaerobacter syntrophicus TaxID=224999 RepID=A0A0U9HQW9_9FIRM|nr:diaminopimelate dehydrogenase [Tepidanaerobacter syntrophicus]GAQ25431.1 diaminopimelate dehydrogenase [Tepidanaerobacter syntrophicus]GLI20022.1 meso-diaminopimelate D-dehydrogenase [Tepidanaerobacter syntrophicus]GLI50990.1 meso-diaminopimelate D-dehydrogenase [Tepidanaerobacter syntrophicus]